MHFRKVLILYVGGTIGMKKNRDGVYIPSRNKLLKTIKENPHMHHASLGKFLSRPLKPNELLLQGVGNDVILYEIQEYDSLLDSSNMSHQDWIEIAKDIERFYERFDGFVILHGTDTLAYTSSALSFMLEGLQKPVILTGSQIPIFETRSDARDNVLSSVILAGCYLIPEVCIFFANKLLRGNRTAKISSTQLDAFDSPNYHCLAETCIEIKLHSMYIKELDSKIQPLKVHTKINPNVALLSFYPTITPEMIRAVLQGPVEGLVIQSYGVGNIPTNRKVILDILKEATELGILIVNVTQCTQGSVIASYETGKAVEEIGVLSGQDMTAEAALTKLCFILGFSDLSYEEKVAMFKEDIRGELTNRHSN